MPKGPKGHGKTANHEMIPRPTRIASSVKTLYPPGSKNTSLFQQMLVYAETFDEFADYMRALIRQNLVSHLRWRDQPQSAKTRLRRMYLKYPLMKNYEDAWPAEAYTKHYMPQLNNEARRRARLAGASSPSPPAIKDERGSMTVGSSGISTTQASPTVIRSKAKRAGQRNVSQGKGKVRSSVSSKAVSAGIDKLRSCRNPKSNVTTNADKTGPVIEIWMTSEGSVISKAQNEVLDFLLSLEPSQEKLYGVFMEAGIVNIKYLRLLARNPQVRDALILKLEKGKRLKAIQAVIIVEGLTRLSG